jgi:hypothetical protein
VEEVGIQRIGLPLQKQHQAGKRVKRSNEMNVLSLEEKKKKRANDSEDRKLKGNSRRRKEKKRRNWEKEGREVVESGTPPLEIERSRFHWRLMFNGFHFRLIDLI